MRTFSLLFLTLFVISTSGQNFPFDAKTWDVNAAGSVFENFSGKQSLYLFRGTAELKGIEFFTGVIEYKIYVTEDRGFPGVRFRITDERNCEEFYIRPHQSGNPDANQYSPIFNGLAGWQMYYGDRFAAPVVYNFNEWNTIKLLVAEKEAEIYINNLDEPALTVSLKQEPKPGGIVLTGGVVTAFHLADFRIEKMNNVVLKSKPKEAAPLQKGTIQTWAVSNSFSEKKLGDKFILPKEAKTGLKWENIQAEDIGYVNISRKATIGNETNTVFAKITIESDKNQVKKFSYGFSDVVRVYLNDQLLASGNDAYATRDYRFLGTVGYYDDLYMNLKKGTNELLVAVTENFGGWTVMGKIEDMEGIVIK